MINDNIADMLTSIRNGQQVKKEFVYCVHTNLNEKILQILQKEGYIRGYMYLENSPYKIKILLKYNYNEPAIHQIHRISKNSKRIYTPIKNLKKLKNGLGIQILSTSKGVLSDTSAKLLNVGGEIICEIF